MVFVFFSQGARGVSPPGILSFPLNNVLDREQEPGSVRIQPVEYLRFVPLILFW